ncbi:MAG: hypothetical protein LAP40_00460 [Acidobacteriia bacterium]|nr:hypothetical protein [Terriglobia bacterium]
MVRTDISLVELSDSQEIAALLASQPQPQRPPTTPRARLSTRSGRRHRCQCGGCPACAENARWDKIFNEKFADPNYYKAQPIRHTSSLSWPPR